MYGGGEKNCMLPDLNALEYFHFLRPAWGLLVIPWIFVFSMLNKVESGRDMFGGIIAPHLLEHLRLKQFQGGWANPRSFTKVIFFIVLIVLMGPSWRQQPSPLIQDNATLVILLDASSSMTQRDIQPSRLARAKQKISDLLALRPDKKAALVVYAGSAHTVLTLTADQTILTQYLAAIKPGIMPRPGKFPEYALANVDEILRQSSSPATVLLIADGLGGDSNKVFTTYFAEKPHQLLILGVGTDGNSLAKIKREDIIPLEQKSLDTLAEKSGGRYIELSINSSDVKQINRLVDSHYLVVEDSALPWLDSGYPLVFPAMALFLMWFRRGWTISWIWILTPLLLLHQAGPVYAQGSETAESESHWFANLWLTGDQQGRLLMQRGAYREAGKRFVDPMWKGLAYYYAEDFMQAAEYFSRSDSNDALFNEANARAQARDYVRAVARYNRLLARTPDFPGAASNRAQVQEIIDETNRLSESQQEEAGFSSEELEPGGDDAVPAQGADEMQLKEIELRQLTAEQILQDPATSEMWLRSVQHDPANFLAIKFNMQLARKKEARIEQDSEK
ncbi:MAG: Ca-activated chloride channel family protein [Halioglobus sp.]|jgi:Ca-activated chloride channel family protein